MKNKLLITIVLVMLWSPYNAVAWNNVDAHMEINKIAFERFVSDKMTKDLLFKNTSLNGSAFGIAWDKSDGVEQLNKKPGVARQKTVKDWIIQGGFSGDEPEGPMSLRHFYDPTNIKEPWLNDSQFVINFLHEFTTKTIVNPHIDARTWALDESNRGAEGVFHENIYFTQDYSWYDAKTYFILALANENNDNKFYGMTWRSVGETMHLVSDMALPAHVRNDGHASLGLYFGVISPKTPGFGKWLATIDPDPIEYYTDDKDIINYRDGDPAKILYNQPIGGLMKELASWTNKNFLSKDTIPIPGRRTMANGASYSSPTLAGRAVDKDDYIRYFVDGRQTLLVHVAKAHAWEFWKDKDEYSYDINDAVKNSQNSLLVPTAIRASVTVLDRFLPRFEATMQVNQTAGSQYYNLYGNLKFKDNYNEWEQRLNGKGFKVNNGAYIVINGKRSKVAKRAVGDFTEFTTIFSANPGDNVTLEYDFGGYVIKSNSYRIPGPGLKPGIWKFTDPEGKAIWPNEIAIIRDQKGKLSATYANSDGITMHIAFEEETIDKDIDKFIANLPGDPKKKQEFYEQAVHEGFFTPGQKALNILTGTWHNPAPDFCTKYDTSMSAFVYNNGKKFFGEMEVSYKCAHPSDIKNVGVVEGVREKLNGEWLRNSGGTVDGSYAPQPTSKLPSVSNPYTNYKPKI